MQYLADPGPDTLRLAESLIAVYRRTGLRIATAESCTGGLLAGAITSIPGASEVFERGFVAYSNDSKQEQLRVPVHLLTAHGAVSAPVAQAMAEGALAVSRADCAVSITGVAGPGNSSSKPEGLVFIGAVRRGSWVTTQKFSFGAQGRHVVRAESVHRALETLTELAEIQV